MILIKCNTWSSVYIQANKLDDFLREHGMILASEDKTLRIRYKDTGLYFGEVVI